MCFACVNLHTCGEFEDGVEVFVKTPWRQTLVIDVKTYEEKWSREEEKQVQRLQRVKYAGKK